MNRMHTLRGMFLTLSSLSSHLGQVSNAANVFMGIRKLFISYNLERWMEDSLRTLLTCSFFFHEKDIYWNNPELTKVPNSTTFLPLFKPGTFSSHVLRLELLGNRKGCGGSTIYRLGVVGGLKLMSRSPSPCVMPMTELSYMEGVCRPNCYSY